ncbi:MAG: carbohydrate ABC transporter permease [Clostridiales bacterium]|nr:carbohydrate ABC transporter permease [Clostridiales bacterium]MDY2950633.1 carbohydrate ABC transporter permease [Eubacteriales bacterium]MDD7444204.1 carbohydrate ABC transporter permease [Clostridiales bacterium]MDY4896042.1 carbohydrate ABC transporter permease [Eubacteriales bacterium]MDY5512100.1 carbohydrate ABC transporter permease [Eubacteriales bacterium]
MSKKNKLLFNSIGKHFLIYIALFLAVFPIFWMFLSSFQPNQTIINANRGIFDFVPTLENYINVIKKYDFLKYSWNSFVVAALATVFSLIIGLPCAYVVARFKLRKASMIVLLVRMIPGISFLLPWFSIFARMGLRDTYTALILTHMLVALPFIVWIMIPNFESIPMELQEAAWIDGCTQYGAFWRIVLRLSIPGIFTASLLAFIFSWNNFMFSLILAGRNTLTLPVAIFNFVSYAYVDWGGLMAGATIITLPIVLLSLCLQKYIISGLTAGAVKG